VGSHVARALASRQEWSVCALVRPSSDLALLQPILDRIHLERSDGSYAQLEAVLRRVRPDTVVHLASFAPSSAKPEQVEEVISANVSFGTALLAAMAQTGVSRFVNTGTFWEQMDGEARHKPVDLYAACKQAFQDILRFFEEAHGVKAVTLRLFGVYGPGDPRPKIFFLLKKSLGKETISLSPGWQELDLVYVDDVAEAYVKAVEYLAAKKDTNPEVFEIGSGNCLPLREIAKVYQECAGKILNIQWGGVPYRAREIMRSRADIRSAKEKLNWKPTHDLKSGISRMFREETTAAVPL